MILKEKRGSVMVGWEVWVELMCVVRERGDRWTVQVIADFGLCSVQTRLAQNTSFTRTLTMGVLPSFWDEGKGGGIS